MISTLIMGNPRQHLGNLYIFLRRVEQICAACNGIDIGGTKIYNVLDDFHAIEAEVEAAGKTVMHVVFDGNYEVFETLEDAKAYYRRYYENYGFVVC